MVFWYFGTAFLRESHRAGGEDLRSTDMILHPVALQGKAVSASTCTRPFTYAKRPSRQRLPFKRLYREAWNRGWSRAEKKVVLGDGAEWIWNLADLHFPRAVQIVDLYHARQHLWGLVRTLYPNDPANQQACMKVHQKRLLDKGKIEKLVVSLRSIESTSSEILEKIRTEADYFERNAERMRYPKFRRQHLFVGSGVIEAGCKTVIGSRLKQSGMFWTVRGANAILALRCCQLNGRFEDYWENRRVA